MIKHHFFYAIKNQHKELVKLLITRDDVKEDAKYLDNLTQLSYNAKIGDDAMVALLWGFNGIKRGWTYTSVTRCQQWT